MENPNKRKSHETKQAYHERLKWQNKLLKSRLRYRKILWPASQGTYVRKEHGDLV
jgi:hypothetical protein